MIASIIKIIAQMQFWWPSKDNEENCKFPILGLSRLAGNIQYYCITALELLHENSHLASKTTQNAYFFILMKQDVTNAHQKKK